MPTCALCDLDTPAFVKSHLIPDSITKSLAGKDGKYRVFDMESAGRRPPTHTASGGIYDYFACSECEQTWFRDADDAFLKFKRRLDNRTTRRSVVPMRNLGGLTLQDHEGDVGMVHRFAVQTLLRLALSTTKVRCDEVKPYIQDLRAVLAAGDTILSNWHVYLEHVPVPKAHCVRAPMFGESETPVVSIMLPHLVIFIAASPRGLDPDLAPLFLRAGATVRVGHRIKLPDMYVKDLDAGIAPGLAYMLGSSRSKRND